MEAENIEKKILTIEEPMEISVLMKNKIALDNNVEIHIEEKILLANKSVLASYSPVFKKMVGFGKPNGGSGGAIYIRGVSAAILEKILNYMTTGSLAIEEDEQEILMSTAEEFRIFGLAKNDDDFDGPPPIVKTEAIEVKPLIPGAFGVEQEQDDEGEEDEEPAFIETKDKKIKCIKCGSVTSCMSSFKRHFANKHQNSQEAKCKFCKKIFNTRDKLGNHLRKQHNVTLSEMKNAKPAPRPPKRIKQEDSDEEQD